MAEKPPGRETPYPCWTAGAVPGQLPQQSPASSPQAEAPASLYSLNETPPGVGCGGDRLQPPVEVWVLDGRALPLSLGRGGGMGSEAVGAKESSLEPERGALCWDQLRGPACWVRTGCWAWRAALTLEVGSSTRAFTAPRRQVHHSLLKEGSHALGTSSSQVPRGGEKTTRGTSLVVGWLRLHTPIV